MPGPYDLVDYIEKFNEKFKENNVYSEFDFSDSEYNGMNKKISVIHKPCGRTLFLLASTLAKNGKCRSCPAKANFTIDNFLENAKKKHGEKFEEYDYSKSIYIDTRTELEITHNCGLTFWQTPNTHTSQGSGCPGCNGKFLLSQDEFEQRCALVNKNGEYDLSKAVYTGMENKIEITHNNSNCKKTYQTTARIFTTGHGCPYCYSYGNQFRTTETAKEELSELYGDDYDYSEIVYKGASERIKIKHRYCGKFFWQRFDIHRRGHGCSHCNINRAKTTEEFIRDSIVYYGEGEFNYDEVVYINSQTHIWMTHKCGHRFPIIPNNHLRGRRCGRCRSSKGELMIIRILEENGIEFIHQHKIPECKNINPLPFDFYLPEFNVLIEFDGEQHFRPVECFGGIAAFEGVQHRDKIKTEFCLEKGISLIRIRFDEDVEDRMYELIEEFEISQADPLAEAVFQPMLEAIEKLDEEIIKMVKEPEPYTYVMIDNKPHVYIPELGFVYDDLADL